MSRRSRQILFLLIATPLLVGAGAVVLLGGGDEPTSSNQDDPAGSPRPDVMGTLVGTVTTADGEPVVGAVVEPRSLDDPSPPIPEITVYTDAEGKYSWRLHPGEYQLVVHAGNRTTAPQPVTVVAGETTTLDLTHP